MEHRHFYISGMTCPSCQSRIQRALAQTPGVAQVSVRYREGTADCSYDPDRVTLRQLFQTVDGLGYRASERPCSSGWRSAGLIALILGLFLILERLGLLNRLVPSQLAESGMGYGALFLVGLVTSVHCVAMCGDINLSQSLPGERAVPPLSPALGYNAGRVLSYTAIGLLLGGLGGLLGLSGGGLSTLLQGLLKLAAGLLMVGMGLGMLGLTPALGTLPLPRPALRPGRRPLLVGLLNGLMPCGPLQSMQLVALASGSALTGGLSMLAFSLGTVPLMLGFGLLVAGLGRRFARPVRTAGSVLVAVMGLAMLAQGNSLAGFLSDTALLLLLLLLGLGGILLALPVGSLRLRAGLGAALLAAGCLSAFLPAQSGADTARMSDGVQLVSSTLDSGSYPDLSVSAGTPVQWTLYAPEGSVNGCNYMLLLPDFDLEYTLHEGENLIEFTPTTPGTYSYSCWMGMIRATITVTDA